MVDDSQRGRWTILTNTCLPSCFSRWYFFFFVLFCFAQTLNDAQIPKFPIYTIYCNNFDSAIQELQKLEKKRKEVKDFMDERATHPRCAGLRLPSLLVTPVQRIPRYMLLFKVPLVHAFLFFVKKEIFQELVEKTPSSHPDYPSLQLTFTKFRDLADFVNNSIRDHENLKKLGDLKKNISGLQVCFPLHRGEAYLNLFGRRLSRRQTEPSKRRAQCH